MNKSDILSLYAYNAWANAWVQDATSRVTHEQFTAPTGLSHGSLRGTLGHLFALRTSGVSAARRASPPWSRCMKGISRA